MTELIGRIRRMLWTIGVLVRSGMLAALRPDKYVRMGLVIWRQGTTPMTGLGLAAARRPNATALVDELGSLTWAQLDTRSDALATALRDLRREPDQTVGILCRNHRGLVESLLASTKLGADSLLLNTGFSGPQLTEVLLREHTGILIYDEEFADLVEELGTWGNDGVLLWGDLHPVTVHRTLDELVPILRRRGILRREYTGEGLRADLRAF